MKQKLSIFWIFFRISLCSFGGGYTVLPLFQKELVADRHWIEEQELTDLYALAQCMPGLILINLAVLVIRPRFGRLAAVFAVLGVMVPPLVIVLLISSLLTTYAELPVVQHALSGIRVAVAALILWSAWRLIRMGVKNWVDFAIFLIAAILVAFNLINVILVIVLAMVAGLILGYLHRRKEGRP